MKIGVLTAAWGDQPLERVLDLVKELGVQAVEIGTGNYPGNGHCNPELLIGNSEARKAFTGMIADRGLELAALSCHGNPLHPDKAVADAHHGVWRQTVTLANMLGVTRVITFSGCPGDPAGGRVPNWITAPWPPEHADLLKEQWEGIAIPYWAGEAHFAEGNGVDICFEMHPNQIVFNPESLLRLRSACGPRICCNMDPSHLFWQGMNPVEVVRYLGGEVIKFVHAKDVGIDPFNTARNGVLDTKHYSQILDRSWVFRTLGYGHAPDFWNAFISMLRLVGYDGVLSIEHEDGGMSAREGLTKAVGLLQACIVREPPGDMTWA